MIVPKPVRILLTGLPFLLAPCAHGEDAVIRDNFASYESGSKPTHPNDNSPFPWQFHPALEATVEDGELPPEASEGAKILRIRNTRSEVHPSIQRLFDPIGEGNTKLRFRMKVRIHQFESSTYYLFFTSTSQPQYGPLIIFEPNGVLTVTHSEKVPGDNTVRTPNPHGQRLSLNTWYAIEMDADVAARTFSVRVSNLERPGQTGITANVPFPQDLPSLNQLFIRPAKGKATDTTSLLDWELTDLELTALP